MKRIILFVIALCLILTACGVESEPEAQEPEIQEPEVIEPDIPEEVSPVYTDWSKLTPYENQSAVYSYYEPRSEDGHLQPRDDYGELLPYLGVYIPSDGDGDHMLYGLVTTDGRVVTEPVYSYIEFEGAFMVLTEVEYQEIYNEVYDEIGSLVRHYSIAAADGSWIMKCESYPYVHSFDNYLVVQPQDKDSMITLNDDGEIVSEFPGSLFKSHFGKGFEWGAIETTIINDVVCLTPWFDDGLNMDALYLDVINGTVLNEPADENAEEEPMLRLPDYESVEKIKDRITGKTYYIGYNLNGDYCTYLLDETGKPLLEDSNYDFYYDVIANDLIIATHNDYFLYVSLETGEVVFSYPIKNNLD